MTDYLKPFIEEIIAIKKENNRLHEVNAELVEALGCLIGIAENFADELSHEHPAVKDAKAALRKATGEKS